MLIYLLGFVPAEAWPAQLRPGRRADKMSGAGFGFAGLGPLAPKAALGSDLPKVFPAQG